MIEYRSIAQLSIDIQGSLHLLPRDLDLVVGIPRSGLLAANILALYLNCALADVDGFIEGRILKGGRRDVTSLAANLHSGPLKVLVLDDSVATGAQFRIVRERLETAGLPHKLIYAAVYAMPEQRRSVDIAMRVLPGPRVFQWNLMHHALLSRCCVDIDGVLCRDPSHEENDDGERYVRFLDTAPVALVPSVQIGALVTCRLERYRLLTEKWLHRRGVQYKQLIMLDLPSKDERQRLGIHAQFKAEAYRSSRAALFIESDPSQAREIARLSRRQVLCTGTWTMEDPSLLPMLADRARTSGRRALRRFLSPVLEQRHVRRLVSAVRTARSA